MSAFLGVSQLFGQGLEKHARKLGYAEDNILILAGDEAGLKARFPETYANLLSCRHQADRRSPLEYGQDLVVSWLFEDYLFVLLKQGARNFTIRRAGADRERKILAQAKVSATSDYELEYQSGARRKLELMNDYAGYWAKNGRLDLRDSKYNKLRAENSLLLAIAVGERQFMVFDFATEVAANYIPQHPPYGFKPVYQLKIEKTAMEALKSDKIIEKLANFEEK